MDRRSFFGRLAGAVGVGLVGAGAVATSAGAATGQSRRRSRNGKDWLYVQTGKSGSLTARAGRSNVFDLVIEGVAPGIIAFTDRPARDVIHTPLAKWLNNFPLDGKTNPPNAALVVPDGHGGEATLVVELSDATYDKRTNTMHWTAKRLREKYKGHKKAVAERTGVQVRDYTLPETFTTPSLLIDGCPITCNLPWGGYYTCGPGFHMTASCQYCTGGGYVPPGIPTPLPYCEDSDSPGN